MCVNFVSLLVLTLCRREEVQGKSSYAGARGLSAGNTAPALHQK